MSLTIKEALALAPGTMLQFNSPNLYEVISVEPRGAGLYIALKRDDGFETFATEGDLDTAELRGAKQAQETATPSVDSPTAEQPEGGSAAPADEPADTSAADTPTPKRKGKA